MGTEVERTVWHLTPRGWVSGDSTINAPVNVSLNAPSDRVETWIETIRTHDTYGGRRTPDWGSPQWVSPGYTEAQRDDLRASIRRPARESDDPRRAFWEFPK